MDPRMYYTIFRHYKGILSNLDDSAYDKAEIEAKIAEKKRELRKMLKRPAQNNRKIVKNYGIDGFIELIHLPKHLSSKEAAKRWFEENEFIESPRSAYDCTGKLFTCWFRIFKRGDEFIAYHRVCTDT